MKTDRDYTSETAAAEMDSEHELPTEQPTPDKDRLAAMEAELAQMRDRWMRAEAEIANTSARAKRELDEARLYGAHKFGADVVQVAEDLQRALNSLPPTSDMEPENIVLLRDGLVEIERRFVGLLERNGIKKIDATGSVFDPNLHEAMDEQESAEHPPGMVLHAWTPSWTLNGRLLRPAMVVVTKAPTKHEPRESHAQPNS